MISRKNKLESRRVYDYICEDCHETSEHLMYPSDKSKIECPTCQGTNTRRVISPARIGWRQMGVDPGFPSAAAKWEKMQRQKARQDKGSLRGDAAPNLKMY